MKSLKEYITESMVSEGRAILLQPEWGEISDIKYISSAADKMERMSSNSLKPILGIKNDEDLPKYFNVYRAMLHCVQDIIDNCLDNHELSEEVQEELATFAEFKNFKQTGYYERVSDNFLEDYEGNPDRYISVVCARWNNICKKATGDYWY